MNLEDLQVRRAAEQLAAMVDRDGDTRPLRVARRLRCEGGCGRTWTYDAEPLSPGRHRGGRPRAWCAECWPRHRREKQRKRRAS